MAPIPAVVERHAVTSRLGKSEGRSRHAGVSRRAQAAKRRGWARGRLDAQGAGTVAAAAFAGAGSARGRRTASRSQTQPRLAPPRLALQRPAGPIPQRPARALLAPSRAEAPAGVACAAMAQHFSLASCDVVGFDLDHTLCRYNLPESAPVSGAGCPGRKACSFHGGWGEHRRGPAAAAPLRRTRPPPARRDGSVHPRFPARTLGSGYLSPATSQV